jgi:hypothetical protein
MIINNSMIILINWYYIYQKLHFQNNIFQKRINFNFDKLLWSTCFCIFSKYNECNIYMTNHKGNYYRDYKNHNHTNNIIFPLKLHEIHNHINLSFEVMLLLFKCLFFVSFPFYLLLFL